MHNFSLSGGQLSVVKRLLEIPEILNDMESVNNKGQTGLDYAIEEGQTEVADTIRAITQLDHPGNHLMPWRHEKNKAVFALSKWRNSIS